MRSQKSSSSSRWAAVAALMLAPLPAWALNQDEPAQQELGLIEELDDGVEGTSPASTPVYHLRLEGGRLVVGQAPWRTVANPSTTDPGEASLRNEPAYDAGVVILSF